MKCWFVLWVLLGLISGMPAWAQLNVPGLPGPSQLSLPTLPTNGITQTIDPPLNQAANTADSALVLLRRTQVRTLIANNPELIEADPKGAPILRKQVVGIINADTSLDNIRSAGFIVAEEHILDGVGLRVVTLLVPEKMSTAKALQQLRAQDANGTYDFNHLYTQSGMTGAAINASTVATTMHVAEGEHAGARVGLIDGGVDMDHPVFRNNHMHRWGCDGRSITSDHGTAVASILVGRDEAFHGAAAGATLYAADVYCGQPAGGAMTTILAALAWLVQQQVPVINISLVGPPNVLLEAMVRTVVARGYLIVAAVGNDGPAAPPLYPASYPNVIGVTAVDAHDRALPEAARGKQVMFAAPGADMAAAVSTMRFVSVRGTSFAAPVVAGLLSSWLSAPNPASASAALATLKAQAADLGTRGVDHTYGNGLVGESVRVTPTVVSAGTVDSIPH